MKEPRLTETQKLEVRADRAEKEVNDPKTARQCLAWCDEVPRRRALPVDLLHDDTAGEINAHVQAIKSYMASYMMIFSVLDA
ncbi:hypothetical protein COO72_02700 [Bifidobacterium callitrichos]|nr:hypothetical protein COO72_02700 [Bifidobacterium callitrichos]